VTHVVEPSADTLLGVNLFRSLDQEQRAELVRHCRGYRYPPRHDVVRHEDTTDDVYFLLSGRVRATIFSRAGKEVAFRDLTSGEVFGDLSAIDGRARCANVITMEESVVLAMSSTAFRDTLSRHPEVAMEMLLELTDLVRRLSDRVVEFSTLGVNNRIHAELLRLATLCPQEGSCVEIRDPPTHADIASRVATRREAVTKELSHLADEGLLEKRSGTLVVCDLPRLQRMVDEVKGPNH
jgi:CRP-like cAMP-binding protein